jgi:hypothetical protein
MNATFFPKGPHETNVAVLAKFLIMSFQRPQMVTKNQKVFHWLTSVVSSFPKVIPCP